MTTTIGCSGPFVTYVCFKTHLADPRQLFWSDAKDRVGMKARGVFGSAPTDGLFKWVGIGASEN
jgi:hypothetical protein